MAAPTLNGSGLGNVTTISNIKNANIELAPLSRLDSSLTKLFDFNGATRSISVSGTYNDTTVANLKTNFIDVIEALLNGYQSTVITFSSDLTGSKSVLVQAFQYEWSVGSSEFMVNYTIDLVEGVLGGQ